MNIHRCTSDCILELRWIIYTWTLICWLICNLSIILDIKYSDSPDAVLTVWLWTMKWTVTMFWSMEPLSRITTGKNALDWVTEGKYKLILILCCCLQILELCRQVQIISGWRHVHYNEAVLISSNFRMCKGMLDEKSIAVDMMNNLNTITPPHIPPPAQVTTVQSSAPVSSAPEQPVTTIPGPGTNMSSVTRLPEKVLEMYNMLIGITSELERIKYELAKREYSTAQAVTMSEINFINTHL